MKKILFSLACLTFITACSGGSDSGSSGSGGGGGGQNQNNGQVSDACPTFNGVYPRKESSNGENGEIVENIIRIHLSTKFENGTFLYSFTENKRFLVADDELKKVQIEGNEGELKVSCDKTSVTYFLQQEDQDGMRMKYVAVSPTQVKIESNNEEAAGMRGTYTRE